MKLALVAVLVLFIPCTEGTYKAYIGQKGQKKLNVYVSLGVGKHDYSLKIKIAIVLEIAKSTIIPRFNIHILNCVRTMYPCPALLHLPAQVK